MEKTVRIASLGISDEFRRLEIGEVVHFPIPKYNYNSIRSTPSTSLVAERMDGKRWKTRLDIDNKLVEVIRVS